MTTLREAAQQALEAMRRAVPTGKITLYEWDKAMSDLDAALAQQAEPVEQKDAARWRFLVDNSFDKENAVQFHVWEHSWEPHSQTGEPTEWKQRVRGPALNRFIDRAIESKLQEKA